MKHGAARWLRIALIGILLAAVMSAGALASSKSVRINTTTKIYKSPSTSSKSVKVTPKKVTLKATSKGWGKVTYKGKTAYIPIKYLTLSNPVKVYATASVKVYKKPGSGTLGTVSRGTAMYFIGVNGKYAHVQNKAGTVKGYVRSAYLSKSKPAAISESSSSSSSSGNWNPEGGTYSSSQSTSVFPDYLRSTTYDPDISRIEYTIYIAQQYIAAPYSTHPNPPATFDCARFCYYCYGAAERGILGASSYSQGYNDNFAKITDIDDLKRGDLVCFNTEADGDMCDHTGIYLGDGKFIHASSAAGMVIVSDLYSGYYKRTFTWGRRIFYY